MIKDSITRGPTWRRKDQREEGPRWWKEASCKGYTFPHRIECTVTTLSTALNEEMTPEH